MGLMLTLFSNLRKWYGLKHTLDASMMEKTIYIETIKSNQNREKEKKVHNMRTLNAIA